MEEMLDRMHTALAAIEAAAEQLRDRELSLSAQAEERVERIVATVESQRETDLLQRLEATESKLAEAEARLEVLAAGSASGRKTNAAGMVATLAKQGISASALDGLETGRMEAGALDAALASLSIEQRFAVKAEMLRSGMLS